jgi:hypothetical protein
MLLPSDWFQYLQQSLNAHRACVSAQVWLTARVRCCWYVQWSLYWYVCASEGKNAGSCYFENVEIRPDTVKKVKTGLPQEWGEKTPLL